MRTRLNTISLSCFGARQKSINYQLSISNKNPATYPISKKEQKCMLALLRQKLVIIKNTKLAFSRLVESFQPLDL